MMIFLLSLAGIPPLAGFFGKFYLFAAALQLGNQDLLWLVALAVGMSAVSLYYYLQVLKQIYVAEQHTETVSDPGWAWNKAVIVLLAILVIAFGVAPGLLVERLQAAIAHGF
jgi:NADH-quinone oxidoreductase subunit N